MSLPVPVSPLPKVLVVGDSHVLALRRAHDAWDPEARPARVWFAGFPGATSEQLARDEEFGVAFLLGEDRYEACVLVVGANDAGPGGLTPLETARNLGRLAGQARANPDVGRVVVFEAPGLDERNARVARLLEAESGLELRSLNLPGPQRSLWSRLDGLHLNDRGACVALANVWAALQDDDEPHGKRPERD